MTSENDFDKQDITQEMQRLEQIMDEQDFSQTHPYREKFRVKLKMMLEPKQKIDLERLLDFLEHAPTAEWKEFTLGDGYSQKTYYRYQLPFGACVDVEHHDTWAFLEIYSKIIAEFPNEKNEKRHLILKYPSPSVDALYGFSHREVEPGFYYRQNNEIDARIIGLVARLKRDIENENKRRIADAKDEFLTQYQAWISEKK